MRLDMMSEWKKVSVSDLGRIVTGKTPKTAIPEYYGGCIPFLTPSDDMSVKYVLSTSKTITEDGKNSVKTAVIPKNSICVSCIGSDLGKVVITTKETVTNQQINSVIVNTELYDVDFVYYAMVILGKVLNYHSKTSTAVPIVNKSTFSQYEILCPELSEQRKIARILSEIDSKIAVNSAINENLEQQAQAIYAQMFIESAEESWETGSLSDISVITMGQSPKGDTFNETGEGAVFYQGRTDFGFRFPTRRLYTTEPKRIALCGDALMSVRAPVGDLNVAYEECCIGRGLAAIHSKDNRQSFVLYTLFTLKKQLDVFNGEGTVFGSINKESLNSMEITIPPRELMDRFESTVSPVDMAIRNNYEEICRLQAIRDTLLPKLMNGEIDVSAVKI